LNGVVATPWSAPHACAAARSWTLSPSAAVVDSAPFFGNYMSAELSPGTWLLSGHHNMWTYRNGAQVMTEWVEENERLVFSPDRSRAVVLSLNTAGGLAVLDAAQGTVAFRLPITHSYAVAYSPEGDTLFAAFESAPDTLHLVRLAAGSGSVIDEAATPVGMEPVDLVLDPEAPWFYVVGFGVTPAVYVIDRNTLSVVATVRAPEGSCGIDVDCGYGRRIAIDPAARRLYVLTTTGWLGEISQFSYGRSRIFDFTLPPVSQEPVLLQP
jgi:hypothetical protein